MKLIKKEKQVLTLMALADPNFFLDYAEKYVSYSKEEIKKIVIKLLKLGLVEKLELSKGKFVYDHTKKVKRDMLDQDLHYKYGSRPLNTYKED